MLRQVASCAESLPKIAYLRKISKKKAQTDIHY
jgi:hypothetical protein